jgi:mevalonate kinase
MGRGHGKVILLGEHSVVHGRPAIAAGMAIGCSARARLDANAGDSLAVSPWNVRVEAANAERVHEREQLRRAFATVCEHCRSERQDDGLGLSIEATMEIPGGAGLGGSAALSVAVIRAIDTAFAQTRTPEQVIDASLAWERIFHGNPSGIDSAMAVRGGLARYVRGQPLRGLASARALMLIVANSGEHGSTHRTVAHVGEEFARDPAGTGARFDAIALLVDESERALARGDLATLGRAMDENQLHLRALGVSTPTLDRMCEIARAAGAAGAKLTGGGGGGCMIALAEPRERAAGIERALTEAGFAAFIVEVQP